VNAQILQQREKRGTTVLHVMEGGRRGEAPMQLTDEGVVQLIVEGGRGGASPAASRCFDERPRPPLHPPAPPRRGWVGPCHRPTVFVLSRTGGMEEAHEGRLTKGGWELEGGGGGPAKAGEGAGGAALSLAQRGRRGQRHTR
jgi:hypothetical protein